MPKVRLSRLWIENFDLDLLMPVFKFLMPGRKVRTITVSTYTFLKNVLIKFKETGTNERKVQVND